MQYAGMLDDLEVAFPENVWDGEIDTNGLKRLIEKYEAEFAQVFQRAAQSPELGYMITVAVGTGITPSPKPALPDEKLVEEDTPPENAHKGERPIYWDDRWHDATILEMDPIQPGNTVTGPAVIEAPATTVLVPPGFEAPLDNNRIYHLRQR
jgi:N-methylhydantoinase A/oxoprolinase/acetone carboxylase beta subunit